MTVKERIEKKDDFSDTRFLVLDPEMGRVPATVSEIESIKDTDCPIWGYDTQEIHRN
jgi:hypothetical protein